MTHVCEAGLWITTEGEEENEVLPEEVLDLITDEDGEFDLTTLIPIPEKFQGGLDSDAYGEFIDWKQEHWGTTGVEGDEEPSIESEEIQLHFDCGYEPPLAWMKELSSRFPDLTFIMWWTEAYETNDGQVTMRAGEVEEHQDWILHPEENCNEEGASDWAVEKLIDRADAAELLAVLSNQFHEAEFLNTVLEHLEMDDDEGEEPFSPEVTADFVAIIKAHPNYEA
jgi:hypothetical protein